MADITFVNLPAPYLEDARWEFPMGLVSLVTYANSIGIKAEFLDLGPEEDTSFSGIIRRLREVKSPIIGVSVVTPAARYLPLFNRFNGKLVVGGPHATCLPNEMIALGFQTVVVGEAESEIPAIMDLKQEGILTGKPRHLDDLPFIDRSLAKGYKGPAPIMTSRSCPYNCTFCSKAEGKYRRRSPENVIEEIQSISDDHIIFFDDTFTMNFEWVARLCELILTKAIKKYFRCSTRADKFAPELLELMRRAGFDEVCVGIESGSQKILDNLNKRTTVAQNSNAYRMVKEAGMRFKAYIMLGCPSESRETVAETIKWLEENPPDSTGLYILHPLPGSDIWNHPEKYDLNFSRDYDATFYGGKREEMFSTVSTSLLSKKEITKIYWNLMEELNAKA